MTIEEYLRSADAAGQCDQMVRIIGMDPPHFVIHPYGRDGDTVDFTVIGNKVIPFDQAYCIHCKAGRRQHFEMIRGLEFALTNERLPLIPGKAGERCPGFNKKLERKGPQLTTDRGLAERLVKKEVESMRKGPRPVMELESDESQTKEEETDA